MCCHQFWRRTTCWPTRTAPRTVRWRATSSATTAAAATRSSTSKRYGPHHSIPGTRSLRLSLPGGRFPFRLTLGFCFFFFFFFFLRRLVSLRCLGCVSVCLCLGVCVCGCRTERPPGRVRRLSGEPRRNRTHLAVLPGKFQEETKTRRPTVFQSFTARRLSGFGLFLFWPSASGRVLLFFSFFFTPATGFDCAALPFRQIATSKVTRRGGESSTESGRGRTLTDDSSASSLKMEVHRRRLPSFFFVFFCFCFAFVRRKHFLPIALSTGVHLAAVVLEPT